jgi:L-fucose/D-arabinose isomerase
MSALHAIRLESGKISGAGESVIGVFAPCDPRVDKASRDRAVNIIKMTAETIAKNIKGTVGTSVKVVYSDVLIDGEKQADIVAGQFKEAKVNVLVGTPDTWAFPQLTLISFLQQFPKDTPINLTCGNSGPKPGVVYTHACSGAIAQYGKLMHINVGTWPDTGQNPVMTAQTADSLLDWCYAALTFKSLQGRRVVVLGHDSMGMETALAHIIPTRNIFGIEITRLDMKLLADMLKKKSYDRNELKELRNWFDTLCKGKIEIRNDEDNERFNTSLAMYLIVRDIMKDLNAVGGGFMSQLEWGSDKRGIPLPVADVMESLFNSTFDHNGRKAPLAYATEADVQGLLTMLFLSYLTAGNPPLFMDFRKVWEPWEIKKLAQKIKVKLTGKTVWEKKGFVDGDNSGSASFDWAAKPGTSVKGIMSKVIFPIADEGYFPGLGNSVMFVSPAGIEGIAGRLAYSSITNTFSLIWDQAQTVELPAKLSGAVCRMSTDTWPHTFVVPKYATMLEYKQFAPANHFHMVWGLKPARLEYWMDMTNVLSVTPWQARPSFIEGVDRPSPLLHLISGGETQAKLKLSQV